MQTNFYHHQVASVYIIIMNRTILDDNLDFSIEVFILL